MGTIMVFWCFILSFGFSSVTAYIDTESVNSNCGDTLMLYPYQSMKLQLTSTYSSINSDCRVVIRANRGQRIMLYFSQFNVQYMEWVELRDGSSSSGSYVSGLFGHQTGGSHSSSVYKTMGNSLFIRVRRSSSIYQSTFKLILTSFHTGTCGNSTEFRCNNGRCISSLVQCNGYNTCGDYSDCSVGLAVSAIAGIVVSCIFVAVVVMIVVGVFCRRQRLGRNPVMVPSATQPYPASTQPYPAANQPYPATYPQQPPQPGMYSVQAPYPTGQQMPQY